jgi:hypothetical protein
MKKCSVQVDCGILTATNVRGPAAAGKGRVHAPHHASLHGANVGEELREMLRVTPLVGSSTIIVLNVAD